MTPAPARFTLDPDRPAPVELPPAWPARPWIYGNVIASRNGIVTWTRTGPGDDPIATIAGGDFTRPGRRADVRLMRQLRAAADAVAFGAQTLRDQPDLVGAADDVGGELGGALARLRTEQGRPRVPLQVVYTESGHLPLDVPLFTTPEVKAIVVTTAHGAERLRALGSETLGVTLLVAGDVHVEASDLRQVHEGLFAELGVRHLDCEGGVVILEALHRAGLLDELFVTVSDVEIDPDAHAGVKRVLPLDAATLVAEGQVAADPGYRFQRWRFNER